MSWFPTNFDPYAITHNKYYVYSDFSESVSIDVTNSVPTSSTVMYFKIAQSTIPRNMNTVDAYNNVIKIDATDTAITAGYYDATTLATQIQTQLIAVNPNMLVSYDIATKEFTIEDSTATNFTMDFTAENNIGCVLGFKESSYTAAATYTSDTGPDLYGPRFVSVSIGTSVSDKTTIATLSIQTDLNFYENVDSDRWTVKITNSSITSYNVYLDVKTGDNTNSYVLNNKAILYIESYS